MPTKIHSEFMIMILCLLELTYQSIPYIWMCFGIMYANIIILGREKWLLESSIKIWAALRFWFHYEFSRHKIVYYIWSLVRSVFASMPWALYPYLFLLSCFLFLFLSVGELPSNHCTFFAKNVISSTITIRLGDIRLDLKSAEKRHRTKLLI